MKSSCGSNWGFSVFDLDSFHLRRAFTAFSTVERLTLVAAGGADSIQIYEQVKSNSLS